MSCINSGDNFLSSPFFYTENFKEFLFFLIVLTMQVNEQVNEILKYLNQTDTKYQRTVIFLPSGNENSISQYYI